MLIVMWVWSVAVSQTDCWRSFALLFKMDLHILIFLTAVHSVMGKLWFSFMQDIQVQFRSYTKTLFILTFFSGQLKKYHIHQSPSDLVMISGENTDLQCQHNNSEFSVILWYLQSPNDTSMNLIGYLYYKKPNVETSFSSHFKVSGDGEKQSTLHLVKPTAAEHSAVYYCAARKAQCSKFPHSATKTFFILRSH